MMAFSSNQEPITLVYDLVDCIVGPNEKRERQVNHSLRLLASTVSRPVLDDVPFITERIKKILANNSTNDAIHFRKLLDRLHSMPANTKASNLNLLYALSFHNHQSMAPRPSSLESRGSSFQYEYRSRQPQQSQQPQSQPSSSSSSHSQPPSQSQQPCDQLPEQLEDDLGFHFAEKMVFNKPNEDKKKEKMSPRQQALYCLNDGNNMISEDLLVKDVIALLQGLTGKYLHFNEKTGCTIPNGANISLCHRSLIESASLVGLNYHLVRKFISKHKSTRGLMQSVCTALITELGKYDSFLSEIQHSYSLHNQYPETDENVDDNRVTLIKVHMLVQEPQHLMNVLMQITKDCQDKKGGILISALNKISDHGDVLVVDTVKGIMSTVTRPYYKIIHEWISEGILNDPFEEFFVRSDNIEYTNETMWEKKYTIRPEMIPSFISESLAKEILLIGKTLNFLQNNGNGEIWNRVYHQIKQDYRLDFSYEDGERMSETVKEISAITNKCLCDLLRDDILSQLEVLGNYLLLRNGDFADQLMTSLHDHLDGPATDIYQHLFKVAFDTVVSVTCRPREKNALEHLDVGFLTVAHQVAQNESGWDTFFLTYRTSAPLNALFTRMDIRSYICWFRYLWKIKKSEYELGNLWHGIRMLNRPGLELDGFSEFMNFAAIMREEMRHFIQEIQNYLLFEVIDTSLNSLIKKIKEATSFDGILAEHKSFLSFVKNSFFDNQEIKKGLKHLTNIISEFYGLTSKTLDAASRHLERKENLKQKIQSRSDQKQWGMTSEDDAEELRNKKIVDDHVRKTMTNVKELSRRWKNEMRMFLKWLSNRDLRNEGWRSLAVRIDFNGYYEDRFRELEELEKQYHQRQQQQQQQQQRTEQGRDQSRTSNPIQSHTQTQSMTHTPLQTRTSAPATRQTAQEIRSETLERLRGQKQQHEHQQQMMRSQLHSQSSPQQNPQQSPHHQYQSSLQRRL